MVIRSLHDVTLTDLFSAFIEAFRDYERTWTRDEFEKMLFRRSYTPELSIGAFDDQRLVSFTLNGIGLWNGVQTAYDTGTGTLPAYRGKGLATRIFEASVPTLKQAGIRQYLLEVLQRNTKAISVYTKIGFSVTRELYYFVQPVKDIELHSKELSPAYSVSETGINENQMKAMWDFQPSWQNNFTAILKKPDYFKIIGAFHGNELIGYGMIEPATGDIPQLAVSHAHRRKGVGTHILKQLLSLSKASSIRVINTEVACESITLFLANHTFHIRGTQYEMIRKFSELSVVNSEADGNW